MPYVDRPASAAPLTRLTARDWLIVFLLAMAGIQCVRGCFFVNSSSLDWSTYAHGEAQLPYQGRVGMILPLRWAEQSPLMLRGASRLGRMIAANDSRQEPMSVEKFISLLAGLLSMICMQAYLVYYSLAHRYRYWWLSNVLLLAICTVSLSVRSESPMWTPYDLPHAVFFGVAILSALDRKWWLVVPLFLIDVPWRETAVFLILICGALFYTSDVFEWKQSRKRTISTLLMTGTMGIYYLVVRHIIQVHYARRGTDAYPRFDLNLHSLAFPQHWSQIFGAGGYLIVFIVLERHLASPRQRLILYCFLLCTPIILIYGVWSELRIWLEWTLPFAAIAATELQSYMRRVPETPAGYLAA